MKKRRLKKSVKHKLFKIPIFIILIYIISNRLTLHKSKIKMDDFKEITKISDSILNKNMKIQNLDRYTYKEGFYSEKLSYEIKERITGHSFPEKFDENYTSLSYDDLRYVRLKYKDFSGKEHNDGEMIVNKEVAEEVLKIFYELYINNYAIEKIKLVEEYNALDELSMQDNNTSAFNYRKVESGDKLSWHCFGLAIDLNPLYNPYILGNELYPSTATEYVDRKREFAGKIDHNDLAFITFKKYGWKWGGDFINSKDYQHFYKDIYDDSIRQKRR